jgi:hypothetical protein
MKGGLICGQSAKTVRRGCLKIHENPFHRARMRMEAESWSIDRVLPYSTIHPATAAYHLYSSVYSKYATLFSHPVPRHYPHPQCCLVRRYRLLITDRDLVPERHVNCTSQLSTISQYIVHFRPRSWQVLVGLRRSRRLTSTARLQGCPRLLYEHLLCVCVGH